MPEPGAILDVLSTSLAACADEPAAGVAAIFFDLDRFKHVNDTYGHAAGDQLLISVGQRLRDNSREASVGRLGGDEFLVVACAVRSTEQAHQLARRLVARCAGRSTSAAP